VVFMYGLKPVVVWVVICEARTRPHADSNGRIFGGFHVRALKPVVVGWFMAEVEYDVHTVPSMYVRAEYR
jgi:hypothetical protein